MTESTNCDPAKLIRSLKDSKPREGAFSRQAITRRHKREARLLDGPNPSPATRAARAAILQAALREAN